jgi:uncharacterized protein (DUF433 family)
MEDLFVAAETQELPRVSIEHIAIDETGCARLAGHRIKVHHIVALKQVHGYSAEQLQAEAYPHLSLAQIHAALTYYYDHQTDMDRQIKEDDEAHRQHWQVQQDDPAYQQLMAKVRARAANESW